MRKPLVFSLLPVQDGPFVNTLGELELTGLIKPLLN